MDEIFEEWVRFFFSSGYTEAMADSGRWNLFLDFNVTFSSFLPVGILWNLYKVFVIVPFLNLCIQLDFILYDFVGISARTSCFILCIEFCLHTFYVPSRMSDKNITLHCLLITAKNPWSETEWVDVFAFQNNFSTATDGSKYHQKLQNLMQTNDDS